LELWRQFGNKDAWRKEWYEAKHVDSTPLSQSFWSMFSSEWSLGKDRTKLTVEVGTEWVNLILQEAEGLPDIARLHRRIDKDPWAISVSHHIIMSRLGGVMPVFRGVVKPESALIRELEGLEDFKNQGVVVTSALSDTKTALKLNAKNAKELNDRLSAFMLADIRNALREACLESTQRLDELALFESSMGGGWGAGIGVSATPADIEKRKKMADWLGKRSEKLNRILSLAGRMFRVADRVQLSKMDTAVGEIVGVKFGDDLEQVLPEELGRLVTGGNVEETFWNDWIEKSLMSYQCEEREPMAKGPVVFMVDESASMYGDREEWTKAIAIVLGALCRKQNRHLVVGTFNTDVKWFCEAPHGVFDEEIIEWLGSASSGGGTRYEPALTWAADCALGESMQSIPNEGWEGADIVFVTDDEAAVKEDWLNKWKERKRTKGFPRVIGLGVDCSVEVLSRICDSVHSVSPNAMGAEGAFII
jgi:uncharacterized protein with von Willebrand factor type A (vWA) domain